jgi:hypothetical protein
MSQHRDLKLSHRINVPQPSQAINFVTVEPKSNVSKIFLVSIDRVDDDPEEISEMFAFSLTLAQRLP